MPLLPTSRKARRRLQLIAVAAPVLALAVGLSLYGLRGASATSTRPRRRRAEGVPADRTVRLGGLVETGSVETAPDGR
jgi:cytochrome c-type biogenesis protein CcmE